MSTKPAAKVQDFPSESTEKIAYSSVSTIPTVEPNDQVRLGYHVWRWLTKKEGTIEQAVKESGSRMTISVAEAAAIITESLKKQGAIQ
jgi:hypothetical protein